MRRCRLQENFGFVMKGIILFDGAEYSLKCISSQQGYLTKICI